MQAKVHGAVSAPAVAVLGTWDPFLPSQQRLLEQMTAYAHAQGLAAVAVLLDPAPTALINGEEKWPVYDDLPTRFMRLRACGVDAVVAVDFDQADLKGTAADFFDVLESAVPVAEFWLRNKQSIGTGSRGGRLAVRIHTRRRGIRLNELPADEAGPSASMVRTHLSRGEVREAARLVGRPPVVTRVDGEVPLAWAPGRYRVAPVTRAGAPASAEQDVELAHAGGKLPWLAWPSPDVTALAILSGPGDEEGSQWQST